MTVPPAARDKALRLVRRGHQIKDAAKRAGVSERSLMRWLKAAQAPAEPEDDDLPAQAPAEPSEPFDASASPDALARKILADSLRVAEMAHADGNTTAATRALRAAHASAHDLARSERERRSNEDVVIFPRAELERAQRSVRDRVAAIAADLERTGGIVCAQCGREIRMRIASKGESDGTH